MNDCQKFLNEEKIRNNLTLHITDSLLYEDEEIGIILYLFHICKIFYSLTTDHILIEKLLAIIPLKLRPELRCLATLISGSGYVIENPV